MEEVKKLSKQEKKPLNPFEPALLKAKAKAKLKEKGIGEPMAVSFVTALLSFPILGFGPVNVGNRNYYLNLVRGKEVKFNSLFEGFKKENLVRNLLLGLFKTIYLVFWTVLLVIPGIFKWYSYCLAPYLVLDRPELSGNGSINMSKAIMYGSYRLRLFKLHLSFIGWLLLSLLTGGILLLWVIPYIQMAEAYFYEEVSKIEFPERAKVIRHEDSKDDREVLLEVQDVDIYFKVGKFTVKACNHLNFKVYKGETFGLVGESGSGKTTITRAIIGINELTHGRILFKGQDISRIKDKEGKKNLKKNIQMIFQDPTASLNERANIDYIVSEGLYNFNLFENNEDRHNKVVKAMREVGLLPEHLSRYPHEFSGGQKQRIGIARALIVEPELVLADEPISSLDVSIRAQVLNLLRDLQEQNNLTYIFIAHDLSIIKYISDRIAVMHQGYVVELGTAEAIYSNPVHPYTKSLLTAIPQPDPASKDDRVKVIYNKGNMDYEKMDWIEVVPEHFVLGTPELIKKWTKKK